MERLQAVMDRLKCNRREPKYYLCIKEYLALETYNTPSTLISILRSAGLSSLVRGEQIE